MKKEELQKIVKKKIEGLEESLKYQLETQHETLSELQTISYFIYLIENKENH